MEEQVQVMYVKVFTRGSKCYLNGSTVDDLGYGQLLTNGRGALYEFTPEQIQAMMKNYERRSSSIELEQKIIPLEEEKTIQPVPTEEKKHYSDSELRELIDKEITDMVLGYDVINQDKSNHHSMR